MPIYGYRCQSCQREFEVQKRMSDPAAESCPECGGPGTRLFYPAGIVFKGGGFYKTDSRAPATTTSSSTPDAAKPAGDGAASSAAATAPKSPSTPAPAPTTPATSKPATPAAAD